MDLILNWFVGTVSSIFAALIVLAVFEAQRRPKLALRPVQHNPRNDGRLFLGLSVLNEPMPKFISWVYDRYPAQMCRAFISIYSEDGSKEIVPEFVGRWAENPEPLIYLPPNEDSKEWKEYRIYDAARQRDWVDIAPAQPTLLNIVVKQAGNEDCQSWDTWSQLTGKPSFTLGPGRYLVKVRIITGGRIIIRKFRLLNDQELGLEPLDTEVDLVGSSS